jgi:hypothetical protein
MRKIVIVSTFFLTTLSLAACSSSDAPSNLSKSTESVVLKSDSSKDNEGVASESVTKEKGSLKEYKNGNTHTKEGVLKKDERKEDIVFVYSKEETENNNLNSTSTVINNQKSTDVESEEKWHSHVISNVYELELEKWRVKNDGTNPIETTKGINDAIVWAKQNGYNTVRIPEGVYLIAKGNENYHNDKDSRINLISDMTLLLDENTVIQKESNGLEGYVLLNIPPDAKNVGIKGGTFKGDSDTHDYYHGATTWKANTTYQKGDRVIPSFAKEKKWEYYYEATNDGMSSSKEPSWFWTETSTDHQLKWKPVHRGTHESGYGIIINGAQNVLIEDVKAINFTGDGLTIGSMGTLIDEFYQHDFKSGSVNEKGN